MTSRPRRKTWRSCERNGTGTGRIWSWPWRSSSEWWTAPAGSMREGHVTTDPRSLTVQMSHAAQDVPITTNMVGYAEEKIENQT